MVVVRIRDVGEKGHKKIRILAAHKNITMEAAAKHMLETWEGDLDGKLE